MAGRWYRGSWNVTRAVTVLENFCARPCVKHPYTLMFSIPMTTLSGRKDCYTNHLPLTDAETEAQGGSLTYSKTYYTSKLPTSKGTKRNS